jgi:prephenate dehydrogenase
MAMERVAIIGAKGAMGALFRERCARAGIDVRGVDRPLRPGALARTVRGADLVLLAVPAEAVPEVADLAAGHMEGEQIMADICSVKVHPLQAMLKAWTGPVVGTHPLFGPEPAEDEDKVALVEGRGRRTGDVREWLESLGFQPFETGAEEHDRAVAMVQGLNFVTTVSYLATLSHRPEIQDFVTPSFRRRLEAARKMLLSDSELFAGLFESNPHAQDAVRAFRSMLNLAAGGDVDLLADRARWWWRGEDFHEGD